MNHYVLLRNSGHNQVFFQNSLPLALAELREMGLPLTACEAEELGGCSYLSFETETALTEENLQILSRCSSAYALFLKEGDLLRPVPLPDVQVFPRSLGTILKYSGKTNEIFTRMLLNLALAQGNIAPTGAKILDPVAGKGTTLFEGFALGADCYGVELQDKSASESYQHLKKFLEKGKYKHKGNNIRFSGANKSFTAKRYQLTSEGQQWEMVSGDSKYCRDLFSKEFFHLIVGDLPYGVQHGNQAGGKHRSPQQLLASCGGGWHHCLKKGGVLALSWNTLVFSRPQMCESLEKQGFTLLYDREDQRFLHQVDQSILRDVILAKK